MNIISLEIWITDLVTEYMLIDEYYLSHGAMTNIF